MVLHQPEGRTGLGSKALPEFGESRKSRVGRPDGTGAGRSVQIGTALAAQSTAVLATARLKGQGQIDLIPAEADQIPTRHP